MTRRAWTTEETAELMALHRAGKRPRIIWLRLGRTADSVRARIAWVTMTPERRQEIKDRVNQTRPIWRRERAKQRASA